jgi:hypothetical protein
MRKFTEKINESVEDKIPTASKWLESFGADADDMYYKYSVEEAMVEFAKIHVKNAVKEQIRIENDRISDEAELDRLTEEALKRTYPLENIK